MCPIEKKTSCDCPFSFFTFNPEIFTEVIASFFLKLTYNHTSLPGYDILHDKRLFSIYLEGIDVEFRAG